MAETVAIQKYGEHGIVVRDSNEAWQLANDIARSGACPKAYVGKPGDIIIAVQFGAEVGLAWMQSLQCIAVVHNHPTMWGDGPIGLVQASGKMQWYEEWWELAGKRLDREPDYASLDAFPDDLAFCCQSKRADQEKASEVSRFSVGDAKVAVLWDKRSDRGGVSTWVTYPKRMLKYRARGFHLRDNYADVLKGIKQTEEVMDYPAHNGGGASELEARAKAAGIVVEGEVVPEPPPAKPARPTQADKKAIIELVADYIVSRKVAEPLRAVQLIQAALMDLYGMDTAETMEQLATVGAVITSGKYDLETGEAIPEPPAAIETEGE